MGITIRKNDRIVLRRGEAAHYLRGPDGKPAQGTVIEVDRARGTALVEFPRPKTPRGEKEKPIRGVEVYKTVRYNPRLGEMGGLKIEKRPIPLCNLALVCPDCGGMKFRREVERLEGDRKKVWRVCKKCSRRI
ncbi:MAG: hypothetical protein N3A38_00125 [Planctomycetota bacterium]|nr:hypothetical protein [Planctomycetota bacterium]